MIPVERPRGRRPRPHPHPAAQVPPARAGPARPAPRRPRPRRARPRSRRTRTPTAPAGPAVAPTGRRPADDPADPTDQVSGDVAPLEDPVTGEPPVATAHRAACRRRLAVAPAGRVGPQPQVIARDLAVRDQSMARRTAGCPQADVDRSERSATRRALVSRHDERRPSTMPIRGEIRAGGFRRVSHGLFLPLRSAVGDEASSGATCRPGGSCCRRRRVFTHLTGARLVGLAAAARARTGRRCSPPSRATAEATPTRSDLLAARRDESDPRSTDCPSTLPEEILLRAARDLGTLDVTVMLDSARRLGHVDPTRWPRSSVAVDPASQRCERAWQLASPGGVGGETVLRLFHEVIEVAVSLRQCCTTTRPVVGAPTCWSWAPARPRVRRRTPASPRQRRRPARERGLGRRRTSAGASPSTTCSTIPPCDARDRSALGRPARARAALARWTQLVENSLYYRRSAVDGHEPAGGGSPGHRLVTNRMICANRCGWGPNRRAGMARVPREPDRHA